MQTMEKTGILFALLLFTNLVQINGSNADIADSCTNGLCPKDQTDSNSLLQSKVQADVKVASPPAALTEQYQGGQSRRLLSARRSVDQCEHRRRTAGYRWSSTSLRIESCAASGTKSGGFECDHLYSGASNKKQGWSTECNNGRRRRNNIRPWTGYWASGGTGGSWVKLTLDGTAYVVAGVRLQARSDSSYNVANGAEAGFTVKVGTPSDGEFACTGPSTATGRGESWYGLCPSPINKASYLKLQRTAQWVQNNGARGNALSWVEVYGSQYALGWNQMWAGTKRHCAASFKIQYYTGTQVTSLAECKKKCLIQASNFGNSNGQCTHIAYRKNNNNNHHCRLFKGCSSSLLSGGTVNFQTFTRRMGWIEGAPGWVTFFEKEHATCAGNLLRSFTPDVATSKVLTACKIECLENPPCMAIFKPHPGTRCLLYSQCTNVRQATNWGYTYVYVGGTTWSV